MTILKSSSLMFLSCGLFLTACTSSRMAMDGQHDKFGAANHANIAAHSVAPDPAKKADTYIPADRERVRAAREAYRQGKVKKLKPNGHLAD